MLHPTRLPDCTNNLLESILDFQELLLELGRSSASLAPEYLQKKLGQQIFNWLDSSELLYKVYQFAKFPQDKKEAILADFRHDRQYIHHLSDNNFQFRLLGDTGDPNRKEIKSWLVKFFGQFAKPRGIGGGIDGVITGGDAINKDSWWQAYSQGNGGRLTCAVCDGTMNHGITVEHYLPKSRYPVLALHPYNLIPACDKCNELKGDKDPLDGRSFQSVVMPYLEAVRDVAHLEFEEGQEGGQQIRIVPNNPNSNKAAEKVGALSALYGLPKQWQQNIHEIGQIACRRVKQHFRSLQGVRNLPPANQIPPELANVIKWMEEDWGTEHYGYPATEWLRWAATNRNPQVLVEEAMSVASNSMKPPPREARFGRDDPSMGY